MFYTHYVNLLKSIHPMESFGETAPQWILFFRMSTRLNSQPNLSAQLY